MDGSGVAAREPSMKEIVIIDGARTAFGTYGGALRDTSATDLGIIAAKGALEKSKVDPKQIDQFVLAGGAENMSMAPHQIRGARWGLPLGEQKLEDYLWVALVDSYNGLGMANTAENLGRKYGITREAADEFAYRSHTLAAKARESCRFSEEIVPFTVKTKKGEIVVDKDEHIRPDTTPEALAKLVARFEKNGTVTPGNASASGVVSG